MKDFEYYRSPKSEYFGFASKQLYKQSLYDEINNTPLTESERKDRLSKVLDLVKKHAEEQNAPYHQERRDLEDEFWRDAREELGYDKFLSGRGVAALESKAWELGHSSGFHDVFDALDDLTEFCRVILGRDE